VSKPPEVREDGMRRVGCCRCGSTLAYADPDPVRAGKSVEIKCWKCNEVNYLIGQDEAA